MSKGFRKITSDKPRQIAFEVLTEVMRNGAYSNLLLPQKLASSGLAQRDKAFTTELLYGSIRQLGRNDFIASKYSDRPWAEVDSGIVDVIRLGAYQLFDMRVPTHAAVDATVNLARKVLGESKASFVNAMMRKLSAKKLADHLSEVQDDSISSLAIRYSHPEWIINSYRDFISDTKELKALLSANNSPTSPTLVAWPTKSLPSEFVGAPGKYSPYAVRIEETPSEIPAIKERRAGIQDEGSQVLTLAFAKAAAEREPWLDLCAGPGGKAALLSYLAKGKFFANEISEPRANLVRQVVKEGTEIIVGDGRQVTTQVNAILADVPCTGLGALRRRAEVRWRRTPNDLPTLTKLQYELAEHAISILPSGGIFGYATCSPHMAETRAQCVAIEKRLPVEKLDVSKYLPANLSDGVVNGYMQLWPHRHE
ncbi:MAG: RsmB/NOP family class I SAM-dependent RNA methyltransferase, partial [Candidatus Nanopelagicaceae bacterium]